MTNQYKIFLRNKYGIYPMNFNGLDLEDAINNAQIELKETQSESEILISLTARENLNDADTIYTCYETNQTIDKANWYKLFLTGNIIDRSCYADFSEWWHDMLRSHVLEKV